MNVKSGLKHFDKVIFLSVIFFSFRYIIQHKKHLEKLYKIEINSKVVKTDDSNKRSNEYTLSDGNYLYLLAPWGDKILIGDSISKAAGTFMYSVYRKNEVGNFAFVSVYDLDDGR